MLNWDHIYYTNVSTSMSQLENNIAVVTGPLLHLAEVASCVRTELVWSSWSGDQRPQCRLQ